VRSRNAAAVARKGVRTPIAIDRVAASCLDNEFRKNWLEWSSRACLSNRDDLPVGAGQRRKQNCEGQYHASGSNAGVGRIIMKDIVAPPALSLADMLKCIDKLNAVDPFGHFVAQLIFDAQP
jgi:hypothetical protein